MKPIATGTADAARLEEVGQRVASLYADPLAWVAVDAVQAALDRIPLALGSEVGVIAVSSVGTRRTMRQIAGSVARTGRVSPLRFAGANPGSLAGLPCIQFGFRGPSLLLTMAPGAAAPYVSALAQSWLDSHMCQYVAVIEHSGTTVTSTVWGAR